MRISYTVLALAMATAAVAQDPGTVLRRAGELGIDRKELMTNDYRAPALPGGPDGIVKFLEACGMNVARLNKVIAGRLSYGSPSDGNAHYNPVFNEITLPTSVFKAADGSFKPLLDVAESGLNTFVHEAHHCEYDVFIEEREESGDAQTDALMDGIVDRIPPLMPHHRCADWKNEHMQEMCGTWVGDYIQQVAGTAMALVRGNWASFKPVYIAKIPPPRKLVIYPGMTLGQQSLAPSLAFSADADGYHQHRTKIGLGSIAGRWDGIVHHLDIDLLDSEKAYLTANILKLNMPGTVAPLIAALERSPHLSELRRAHAEYANTYAARVFFEVVRALRKYVGDNASTKGGPLDVDVAEVRERFAAMRLLIRNTSSEIAFKNDVVDGMLLRTGDPIKEKLGRFLTARDTGVAGGTTNPRDDYDLLGVRRDQRRR